MHIYTHADPNTPIRTPAIAPQPHSLSDVTTDGGHTLLRVQPPILRLLCVARHLLATLGELEVEANVGLGLCVAAIATQDQHRSRNARQ